MDLLSKMLFIYVLMMNDVEVYREGEKMVLLLTANNNRSGRLNPFITSA